MSQPQKDQFVHDDTPPFFPSWKGWYAVVIGALLFLIILFYFFQRMFE